MTVREITKLLISDGWYYDRCKGSHKQSLLTRGAWIEIHKQYKHPIKKGTVTIPNHSGDLKPKTATSILKQAGLK
ncbi:MAG: type II toxin-antitoxin system HicA family toxin [Ruminococcus sp.]|nr:type II toxin-antitoxin system HicA family toxin [Ruminococcus sp.]